MPVGCSFCFIDQVVGPTPANLVSALQDFQPTSNKISQITRYIVDGPGKDSYPLAALIFAVTEKNWTSKVCEMRSIVLSFLLWGLTNSYIVDAVADVNYASLPSSWSNVVVEQLATITCNGKGLLRSALIIGVGPGAPFLSSYSFFYGQTQSNLMTEYSYGDQGLEELQTGEINFVVSANVDQLSSIGSDMLILYVHTQILTKRQQSAEEESVQKGRCLLINQLCVCACQAYCCVPHHDWLQSAEQSSTGVRYGDISQDLHGQYLDVE